MFVSGEDLLADFVEGRMLGTVLYHVISCRIRGCSVWCCGAERFVPRSWFSPPFNSLPVSSAVLASPFYP